MGTGTGAEVGEGDGADEGDAVVGTNVGKADGTGVDGTGVGNEVGKGEGAHVFGHNAKQHMVPNMLPEATSQLETLLERAAT